MKSYILVLMPTISILHSCSVHNDLSQSESESIVKVTIMYPNGEGKTFDLDYYKNEHMPMLKDLFGDKMIKYRIDEGLRGRTNEDEIPFLAIGYLYFKTISEYETHFAPNREKILGDIENYTNIRPIVQFSREIN